MMEIQLPELDEQPLDLVPESTTRTFSQQPCAGPSTALAGRLRLGGPVAIPISAAYAANDAELRAFVAREAGRYRYHLVHLALTAASERGDPRLERVTVQLALSAADGAAEPIAWSMTPARVTDVSQLSLTWRLGPQVKLVGVEAGLGSVERTSSRAGTQFYLEALNELRADPVWELRRTRGLEIRGGHRLGLVVRTAAGAGTRIDGAVHATVALGGRPLRGRARLPDVLSLSASM